MTDPMNKQEDPRIVVGIDISSDEAKSLDRDITMMEAKAEEFGLSPLCLDIARQAQSAYQQKVNP